MTHSFTVEADGQQYKCERVVTGLRAFRQIISVLGVGSKCDPVTYGARGTAPVSSMESVAGRMAEEIIGENPLKAKLVNRFLLEPEQGAEL